MHADQISEQVPMVSLNTNALEAAHIFAENRLLGLVVLDMQGKPYAILPASQVVRCLVPSYVIEDPSLAGVLNESMADRAAEKLKDRTVADLLPAEPQELPAVNHNDTIIEVAAIMARLRCPLTAVLRDDQLVGVITASRLLELALFPR